jgi:hypothetical protein
MYPKTLKNYFEFGLSLLTAADVNYFYLNIIGFALEAQ